jgi:DNA-directed RNA polymerase subunit RPC12/RpoP
MNLRQFDCPHCLQQVKVQVPDSDRMLRCPACGQSPGSAAKMPEEYLELKRACRPGQEVVAVRCQRCQSKFGVRQAQSGKVVRCPSCDARQRFRLVPVPDKSTLGPVTETVAAQQTTGGFSPQPPVAGDQTGVDTGPEEGVDPAGRYGSGRPLPDRARRLLPPRYTVPEELEEQVHREMQGRQRLPEPGIKTGTIRIHGRAGREAVEVRSLSGEEKYRRKNVRVSIVFLTSVAILVALLLWLVQRSGSGS